MTQKHIIAVLAAAIPFLGALIPSVSEAVHNVGGQDALVGAGSLIAAFIGYLLHGPPQPKPKSRP